jgi:hypothetical protein
MYYSLLDSSHQAASNANSFISLASINDDLSLNVYKNVKPNNLACIDARDMKLLSLDAP